MITSPVTTDFSTDKPINIVVFTDTHLLANKDEKLHHVNTYSSLAKAFTKAKSLLSNIDAVFVTGDISEDGSINSYNNFKKISGDLMFPVFDVPGNHDDTVAMAASFAGSNIQMPTQAVFGQWVCLFVNSQSIGNSHGFIADDQLSKIRNLLSNPRDKSILLILVFETEVIWS